MGALGATAALAACGGSGGKANSNAEFSAVYQGAASSEVIDPNIIATMFIDQARVKHLYDGLFEFDSTMTPRPDRHRPQRSHRRRRL